VATRQKSAGGSLLELVVIVAVALGLALGIQAFLVKPYRIPSESMVPTLQVGQRVLVNRIGNRFTDPRWRRHRLSSAEGVGHRHLRRRQPPAGPGVRQADRDPRGDVNFIKRVVGSRRQDLHQGWPRLSQRPAESDWLHQPHVRDQRRPRL
jgi:signal peptidase I